jgi:hypothetical protein
LQPHGPAASAAPSSSSSISSSSLRRRRRPWRPLLLLPSLLPHGQRAPSRITAPRHCRRREQRWRREPRELARVRGSGVTACTGVQSSAARTGED